MSKCKCGHEQGQHIYDEGLCRPGFICDCKSFSPAEPKCAECECGHGHTYLEIDGGLAPLMNQLCVSEGCDCESYRPAEPDATERVNNVQQALSFLEKFNHRELNTYEWMADFLESETPRIKADAVREFVGRFEKKHPYQMTGEEFRIINDVYAVAKEMTEVV